jgi:hypothetical protein
VLEAHQVQAVVEKPDRGALMGLTVKLVGFMVEVEVEMVLLEVEELFELSGLAVQGHFHPQVQQINKYY